MERGACRTWIISIEFVAVTVEGVQSEYSPYWTVEYN